MDAASLMASLRRAEDRAEAALADQRIAAAVVFGAAAAVFAMRYAGAASVGSAGPDYGHYLIAQNWYALRDNAGEGAFDPPAVPFLLLGLSVPLGRMGALQAAGPLAAAALLPCAYYLLCLFTPRWGALLTALAFSLWGQFTELITFGGVTNLFGIAASLLAYRAFFEATESPTAGIRPTRREVECALLLVAVLSIHHLTAFVTGATILVWTGARLASDKPQRRAFAWSAGRTMGLAAAFGAVYIPYLFGLLDSEVTAGFGRGFDIGQAVELPAFVFRDLTLVWQVFLALAVTGLWRFDLRSPGLPFAVAVLATPFLLVFTILGTHPVRGLFYETFAIVGIAALWSARDGSLRVPRKLPARLLGLGRAAFFATALVGIVTMSLALPEHQQRALSQYHQYYSPGMTEALDWVGSNTPPGATIAVDRGPAGDYNDLWQGMATGWWLEGWANRRAIYEANPVLLPFKARWPDSMDANRLFAGDTTFENGHLRVADNFPLDDAALPSIHTAYLGDYHEFVGFSSPRLLNSDGTVSFTLDEAAQPDASAGITGTVGWAAGTYAGPGFRGERRVTFEGAADAVTLAMNFTLEPGTPWSVLEVSLTMPPLTLAEFQDLPSGRVALQVPDSFGFSRERATLELRGTNLSAGALVPAYLSPGVRGAGLRFAASNASFSLLATVTVTALPDGAPASHPLSLSTAAGVLAARSVTFLYVGLDSPANIQRFDRDPARLTRVFANSAAVVFGVR